MPAGHEGIACPLLRLSRPSGLASYGGHGNTFNTRAPTCCWIALSLARLRLSGPSGSASFAGHSMHDPHPPSGRLLVVSRYRISFIKLALLARFLLIKIRFIRAFLLRSSPVRQSIGVGGSFEGQEGGPSSVRRSLGEDGSRAVSRESLNYVVCKASGHPFRRRRINNECFD